MAKIVVDPITRIEGHLRIEAELEGGRISKAWSSGTMFRGMELILKGRDPREAWLWAQRICNVCTMVHAIASVRAVENALGIEVPDNARIIRNIISAAQMIQDHVVHFYHLHALDWVDVTLALKADPQRTAQLAASISEWPKSSADYFGGVRKKVKTLVDSGQLSLFASGYWGNPAYRLPPEANLLAVAHYLEALDWQRQFIRIHAVLGAKNPNLQTYLVGGMSTTIDANVPEAVINAERIDFLRDLVRSVETFVAQVYVADVLAVAPFYPEWFKIGEGTHNFLACGDYPSISINDTNSFFVPRGIILNRDLSKVHEYDPAKVTEYVTHSWYTYDEGNDAALPPYQGETRPAYSGPTPPYKYLDTDAKYSWLKSPRYEDMPMEVGPLARVLVAYASGRKEFVEPVNAVLGKLKAPPEYLFSTLGRTAARAIETLVLASQIKVWVEELATNMGRGETRIHNGERWDPGTWPRTAQGFGFHEAPRGALGHWIQIEDRLIKNYQFVVPSTWNGSPRDAHGQPGPYEAALVDTPLPDPEQPVEILRTIHSFDPCLACAVHLTDARGRSIADLKFW
jgi:Ni,Fe-hydrogenase I large subunit